MANRKRRREKTLPPSGKRPDKRVEFTPPGTPEQVSWRFGLIDFGGPWCWAQMDETTRKAVYRDLAALFEGKKWVEIPKQGHSKGHAKQIRLTDGKTPKDLKARLQKLNLDPIDHLWELRLSGTSRVWGMLSDSSTFHVLWWDPDHTVWPMKHQQKGTGN